MSEQLPIKKWFKKTDKAKVYLSEKNGVALVIKEIRHDGDVEGTKKSYDLIRSLNHPQIPKVLNLEITETHVIVEREYVAGRSLEEICEWLGPLALETVIRYMASLLKIVTYIHSLKTPIIHRDIKPSNIIMGADGYLYLIDFGIAKVLRSDKTSDTTLVGTMGYAAPEQFGYGQSDERTDLYNLSRTIQRLLIGVAPSHRQFNTLWDQKKKQVAKDFVKIIETGIKFNSSERYPSAQAMADALDTFVKKHERDKLITYKSFAVVALPALVLLIISIIINGALYSGIRQRDEALAKAPTKMSRQVVYTLEEGAFADPQFEAMIKGYFERYQMTYSTEALLEIEDLCIVGDQMIRGEEVDQSYWDGNLVTVTSKNGESFTGHGKLTTLYDMRLLENVTDLFVYNQTLGDFEGLKNSKLERLVCQNSQLSSLRSIENLTALTYLDVSHNYLDNLKDLTHLDQLKHLNGSDNEINSMTGLEHNIYMASLDLHDNLMSDASVVSELKYLTALDLSGNYLTTLDVGQLKQLMILNVSGNFLRTIEGLEELKQLGALDVSNNDLNASTEELVRGLALKGVGD